MNKKLGDKTLHQIQTILTRKSPQKKTPQKKERQNKSPVLECTCNQSKSPNKYKHALYQPMEKDNIIISRQLKNIQHSMIEHQQFRVQNKHSYYLNAKNPKPPLYQRTQQILRERQIRLESQRQQQEREKNEKEEEELLQFLQMNTPSKKISKYEALQLTDKLYKDHYSKTLRMTENKVERLKEDAKYYRNKPQISTTSRDIFKLMAERQQLDRNVVERFKQYDVHKNNRENDYEKLYRNYYYPFKPEINLTSRKLISQKDRSFSKLPKPRHCTSCTAIKSQRSTSSLAKTQRLQSQYEPETMKVSQFQ